MNKWQGLVFLLLSQAYVLNAQLLGCDDIDCTEGTSPKCSFDDITADALGISNMSSVLTQKPFTWTVAISRTHSEGTDPLWRKDYYLGQPSTINSSLAFSSNGCALFFEGISSSLQFHADKYWTADNGVCEDALGTACLQDWMAQISTEAGRATDGGRPIDCGSFAETLRSIPPASCHSTNGSWGAISARRKENFLQSIAFELTDPPEIPLPAVDPGVNVGECHPTNDRNYSIHHIIGSNTTIPDLTTAQKPFLGGVMPVLTILTSSPNSTAESGAANQVLQSPEIHLNCMKPIQANGKSNLKTSLAVRAQSRIGQNAAILLLLVSNFVWTGLF